MRRSSEVISNIKRSINQGQGSSKFLKDKKVAVLFQAQTPPVRNGIVKPLKPGGYSDSGADIAYCLKQNEINIITPKDDPNVQSDLDWVFPDTREGINDAIGRGANILWLNTVLYDGHPIAKFIEEGTEVVGQDPKFVDIFDDKWVTNNLLKSNDLPIPKCILINSKNFTDLRIDQSFPVVLKPIRGRGSQGVTVVENLEELKKEFKNLIESKKYGDSAYLEEYLPGQEITLTVMPPGNYFIDHKSVIMSDFWCLPAVKRFNHEKGIAPYCGVVAVVTNSSVLPSNELQSKKIRDIEKQCITAAKLVNAKAPIRIDCRENAKGEYIIFDLNMKPNNTGPSRPHRLDQDSLMAIAAKNIGWNYLDLLTNILLQSWKKS